MTRNNIAKLGRVLSRNLETRAASTARTASVSRIVVSAPAHRLPVTRHTLAAFSTSARHCKPLGAEILKTAKPANISDEEYHKLADQYIEGLLSKYEDEQDAKGNIDVEYSAGVMTIRCKHGDYVVNKQPPNKQIWLSSPLSGPKRYDWVVISEGQDSKQDTATGYWVYLRDGTSLTELLHRETGVNLDELDVDAVETL